MMQVPINCLERDLWRHVNLVLKNGRSFLAMIICKYLMKYYLSI